MFDVKEQSNSQVLIHVFNLLGRAISQQNECHDEGFTIIIGAGCSLSSSDKNITTSNILKRELEEYTRTPIDQNITDNEIYKQFVNYWQKTGEEQRRLALSKYFKGAKPSIGYQKLRVLAEKGLVNKIITTNFDLLIDDVMKGLSYNLIDYDCNITKVGNETPLFQLVKVHGDLKKGHLKFAPIEVMKLPQMTEQLIKDHTKGPTLVVGYSGQDSGLMQSLNYDKSYNAFWATPKRPESFNNYDNDNIFSWLKSRNSENNLLFGKTYGYFDSLMTELVNFFTNESRTEKSELSVNSWQQTTIYRMIRMNSSINLIFHTLIDLCENIVEKEKWTPKFPHYADNYELLIEAYLYFFRENQLPTSILQIPSNEVDALLIGISIEVLARSSGTNLSSKEFLKKLQDSYSKKLDNYKLDESFWSIIYQILNKSNEEINKEGKTQISLNNGGRLQLSIDRIPLRKISDMLNTINVLALSLPTAHQSYANNGTFALKMLLQNNVIKIDIIHDKIRLILKDISSSDFYQLIAEYLLHVPNFHGKIVNEGVFSSRWIEIVAKINHSSESESSIKERDNIWDSIKEYSSHSVNNYLSLSSPFAIKAKDTVQLQLDKTIAEFLSQKKNAFFILGSSGSGKSTAISSLINTNGEKTITPIVLSPKSSISFKKYGINLFFNFLLNGDDKLFKIKVINDAAKDRNNTVILILDGLNEIEGDFEHVRQHYIELLQLADDLEKQSCFNIKLIITCRDSIYANLAEKTKSPNPKSFYSPDINEEKNSYYQVQSLKFEEQELLIDTYFCSDEVSRAFKDLLKENNILRQKYAHPYLIAVSGSVLRTIEDINGLRVASDIFRRFAHTMFDRIGDGEDRFMAKKILNIFFKESIKIGKIGIKVSRFKILSNLSSSEVKLGEKAISYLQDVNILRRNLTNRTGYLEFSHDRIAEYFLGEFLYDEQIWSKVIDAIVVNSKFDAISYGGLKSFFLKYLDDIKGISIKELYDVWLRLEEITLFDETNFIKVFTDSVVEFNANTEIVDTLIRLQDYNPISKLKIIPIELIINGLLTMVDQTPVPGIATITNHIIQNHYSKTGKNDNSSKLLLINAKFELHNGKTQIALRLLNKAKNGIQKNDLLLDKILLLIAVINREIGKKKHAIELFNQVYNNQLEKGAILRVVQTALELGMALRDNTEFEKALMIYENMWNQVDSFDDNTKARLNNQLATIYKNKLQFHIKVLSNQKAKMISNNTEVIELENLFSIHNSNAIYLSEENNNLETLLDALVEKIEVLILLSKFDSNKTDQIGLFINKTETVLSYFPIASRRVDISRMHAKIVERNGDYKGAINYLRNGKKIATQYNLAYKNCDCDYHLGFLITRILEKLPTLEYFNIGLNAFDSAIEYYESNVSSENKYLKDVYNGKNELLQLAKQLKIK